MTKKILLYAFMMLSISSFAQLQTLSVRVNSSSDDAEERGSNATSSPGLMDLTSSDLELVRDGNDGDQWVGMRFNNITIPSGSIINNAYIQFTVDENDAASGTIILHGEATDNSLTFTSANSDISGRQRTTDSVSWSAIPVWNVIGAAGVDQQTPDISSIIQEIVDRSGWVSGNSLNIIAHGTGERVAESYDGVSSSAPLLVIEYSAPVNYSVRISSGDDDAEQDVLNGSMYLTSSDLELTADGTSEQLVGLRFGSVDIPAGSIIQNAYIQFTVDESTSTGVTDVYISAEDTSDAPAITAATSNLSSRNYLSDFVIWNAAGWPNIGDSSVDQRTPDLSVILQKVIDKQGWTRGNAVLFGMIDPSVISISGYTGNTGKRTAESYNGVAASAPKLVVSYIPPATYQPGGFPISEGASWLYNDSGLALPVGWASLNYNDSSWAYGNAQLGYGESDEATVLDFGGNSSAKHITTYLRHKFNVTDPSIYDSLVFDMLRDDGVVVYVNGTEAFRMNMPAGAITNTTLASSAVAGSAESTFFTAKTSASLLQPGLNVIAVELHQSSASSSDLSFDMRVGFELPPLPPTSFPLKKNTAWHYLDDGSNLDAVLWQDTTYNDDNWDYGPGPLGYGDPMNTTVSFGPDPNNKYITTYFRRDLTIDTTIIPDSLQLGIRRDDGAIVYINGTEIFRTNMPASGVTYTTTAPTTVSGSNETTYYTHNFHKSAFRHGRNVVAVRVHNRDIFSSDLGFDMYIEEAPIPNPPGLGCANDTNHIACFTSIAPTSNTSNLLIPSSHRFQMLFKQGDAYSIGSGTVPGNHDFTGYVALNGSSTLGHVSVNHENSPGGVSILDVHYIDTALLWSVDSTQAVDFFNNDLVTTTRNCSGGITPWGTVISCEETYNSGDVNNDGYTDVGWAVEIDPLTAKVVEYGNGKQEKLWAVGRMSHENVVVANDSITLYTGEDGGSSAVFKFVANNKADMSAGTLYALKLDNPMSSGEPTGTTGTWVMVPNTTQSDRNTTRSLAISLGATNFNGVEDIEISPLNGEIYFTSKGNGRIYRFSDDGSSVSQFETFVGGKSYVLTTDQGVYTEPWGGGNDNLDFDDEGNLWVLQDGGNDYIWVVRPNHTQLSPKVELFASSPLGSEPTGITFTPDHKFAFLSIQHPSSANQPQLDATFNNVTFNGSATIVIAKKQFLGAQVPVAGFEADTQVVVQGNNVIFTDTSSNYPSSWNWTFAGGSPATGSNATETVTYNSTGFYQVELKVANAAGQDSIAYTQYIEVIQPAPMADFVANQTSFLAGDSATFTDLSTNDPDSWNWTFPGGTPASSTDSMPTVTYANSGVYNVTLVSTNRAGNSTPSTKSSYIVVQGVGIRELGAFGDMEVFPNPTSGAININTDLNRDQRVTIEIYDLANRKIAVLLDTKNATGQGEWEFDLSQYIRESQTVILSITVGDETQKGLIQFVR